MRFANRMYIASVIAITATACVAQTSAASWELQDSNMAASFRGIHAVSERVAWASGTNGAVLRTTDGGTHWQKCTVPPGAEKLDFRAVWAWDAQRAVVMSAGPGDQSRIFSTNDACAHWTEVRKNTEKDGFWDGLVFGRERNGILIGDPVRGRFYTEYTTDGLHWRVNPEACAARESEAAFAASNSSVVVFGPRQYILGTGGKGGPRALRSPALAKAKQCAAAPVPVASGNDSSGVFSLAFRDREHGVAVGGDYQKPKDSAGTAAWTADGGEHWTAAQKPPHGYRSSVAWDAKARAWIAAGTNGSDISFDDGKTWKPLDDGNWNALSLPFVVGPKGRIGRLREHAPR